MSSRKWLVTGAGLGFILASGFALGVGFGGQRGREVVVAEPPPRQPPSPAPAGDARTTQLLVDEELKNTQLRQRVAELQRELQKTREGGADGGQATAPARIAPQPPAEESFRAASPGMGPDQPLPFPNNAPEQYTPKGFEKVAFQAAKDCGMGLEVIAVDCSEFPCIAWTKATDSTVTHFSMEGCGPWAEAFKHGTMVVASVDPSDGGSGTRFFSWMAIPPDPADIRIAMKRAKERTQGMKAALGIP